MLNDFGQEGSQDQSKKKKEKKGKVVGPFSELEQVPVPMSTENRRDVCCVNVSTAAWSSLALFSPHLLVFVLLLFFG